MNKSDGAEIISEYLKEDDVFIVDVRTPEEFAEGTAEGAINIPLQVLEENYDQFEGKDKIIVFCRSGNRSGQAKEKLLAKGFKNVINGGPVHEVVEVQQKG